jgi:hypothetical protein
MIAGHFSMDFKKLPSTTPPFGRKIRKYTLQHRKKTKKRKRGGKKKRLGRMRKLENSLEALATLAGGASATHFAGRKKNSFALRKSINTRERKREREREKGRE